MSSGNAESPVDIEQLYLDITKENKVEDIKATIALMGQDLQKTAEEYLNQWKLEFDQQLIDFEKSPSEEERRTILEKTRTLQAKITDKVQKVSQAMDKNVAYQLDILGQKTSCMNSSHPVLKSRPELIPLIETKLAADLCPSRIQGESLNNFIDRTNWNKIYRYSERIIRKMEDKLKEESF